MVDFVLRDMPTRHRSMCAAFDCSQQQLCADDTRLLARPLVFRGGFCGLDDEGQGPILA